LKIVAIALPIRRVALQEVGASVPTEAIASSAVLIPEASGPEALWPTPDERPSRGSVLQKTKALIIRAIL